MTQIDFRGRGQQSDEEKDKMRQEILKSQGWKDREKRNAEINYAAKANAEKGAFIKAVDDEDALEEQWEWRQRLDRWQRARDYVTFQQWLTFRGERRILPIPENLTKCWEHFGRTTDKWGGIAAPTPIPNITKSVLQEAQDLVDGKRADDYGDLQSCFERIGAVWGALLDRDPIPPRIVAVMMVGLKAAREVGQHKRDNNIDAAGYAHIAEELS